MSMLQKESLDYIRNAKEYVLKIKESRVDDIRYLMDIYSKLQERELEVITSYDIKPKNLLDELDLTRECVTKKNIDSKQEKPASVALSLPPTTSSEMLALPCVSESRLEKENCNSLSLATISTKKAGAPKRKAKPKKSQVLIEPVVESTVESPVKETFFDTVASQRVAIDLSKPDKSKLLEKEMDSSTFSIQPIQILNAANKFDMICGSKTDNIMKSQRSYGGKVTKPKTKIGKTLSVTLQKL